MRKSRNVFATASAPRLRPSPLPWHPDQLFGEHAEAIRSRDGSMTGGNRGGRGGRGGQGAATFLSPSEDAPGAQTPLATRRRTIARQKRFPGFAPAAALPRHARLRRNRQRRQECRRSLTAAPSHQLRQGLLLLRLGSLLITAKGHHCARQNMSGAYGARFHGRDCRQTTLAHLSRPRLGVFQRGPEVVG